MMEEYLEFAKHVAFYAGDLIKKNFNNDIKIEYKEDRTPVTEIDKNINHYLITQVKKHFPYHDVLGEEESYINGNDFKWVCDPIDGTSMFTRGIPVSVFSLALVYNGEPIVGVVYDPYQDKMYSAIKGSGAYCNNEKIKVSNLNYGDKGATVDYCMWNGAKYDTLDIIKDIRSDVKTCQIGSVAHACMLVASGKIIGELFPGTEHGNCDIAASKIIVEEAGGKITSFIGKEQRYDQAIDGALITNKVSHDKLLQKIKKYYK